LEPQVSNLQC